MAKLTERTKTLILMGARETGSFIDAYIYVEESLYVNEAIDIHDFCEWIDKNVGGAGSGNIDKLYQAYKKPNDKELQAYVIEIAAKINSYKRL